MKPMISAKSKSIIEVGGTCCPTCGVRQAHIHCGWLAEDVLFTRVVCENKKCGDDSLIVRLEKRTKKEYPNADVREKLSGEEKFRSVGDAIINHFKERSTMKTGEVM